MRARTGAIILGLLLAASVGEAGWLRLGRGHGLPKPREPVLGSKVKEGHKPGNKQRHPAKYGDPTWGDEAGRRVYRHPSRSPGHYNKV